jgi:hypothetical protein
MGQEADEVIVDVFQYTQEQLDSLASAIREARYVRDTTGAEQKLLYADFSFDVPVNG